MPTFSSSVYKPGAKRVAPKAPPRRALRTASIANTRSVSQDTPSYSQSIQGTPERQVSDISRQENQVHLLKSAPTGLLAIPTPSDGNSSHPLEHEPSTQLQQSEENNRINDVSLSLDLSITAQDETTRPQKDQQQSAEAVTDSSRAQVGARRSQKGALRTAPAAKTKSSPPTSGEISSIASNVRNRRRKAVSDANSDSARGAGTNAVETTIQSQALEQGRASNAASAKSKRGSETEPTQPNKKRKLKAASTKKKVVPTTDDQAAKAVSKQKRSGRQRKSVQEIAEEVVAEAVGMSPAGPRSKRGRRPWRRPEPDEAENHQLIPEEVRMIDLVKDQGVGKGSVREAEMEKIDWTEVKQKRREAEEERLLEEQKHKEARKNGQPLPKAGPHATEQLVLINGQIIVEDSSRVIDRNAVTARDADEQVDLITEDRLTTRVNQSTIGRKASSTRMKNVWDDEETEQFYSGLRMFGTDFMMISKMFPGTSRGTIKKKYTKEERLRPHKVTAALSSKEPVDLKALSELTQTDYGDPRAFYQELDEEKTRLEAEDAKTRAEEVQVAAEIHESIEQDGLPEDAETEVDAREQHSGGPQSRKNRFASEARRIMDHGKGSRKKNAKGTVSSKKDAKGGKNVPAEGTEEMLGSIDDIDP